MSKKIVVLLACLLLGGCSVPLGMGMDDLLSPPRLTAEQSAIYDALERAIGTNAFKFKYPRRGAFLSACILRDLDRDGVSEAIAFYEWSPGGVTTTWMSVLVQRDGSWKSVMDLPGDGTEVDLVEFAPITSTRRDNIVVGWSVAGRDDMNCVVYSYDGERVERLNRSDGSTSGSNYSYSEMLITDVDLDGLDELILCAKSSARPAVMRLIKYREALSKTSEVQLPGGLKSYLQVRFGPLTNGLSAVFADIALDGGTVTTEIAVVDRSILSLLSEEELGVYESFDRPAPTLTCADVNGDGLIDIPVMRPLPGYENVQEGDKLYLTEFKSILDGSLSTVLRTVVNFKDGYQIRIPEEWADGVTVRRQPDTGEWRFVLHHDGAENAAETELLRVKVVSPSDYQDKFETVSYREMATKGVNRYLTYIPPVNYPGFSITDAQLDRMFALL